MINLFNFLKSNSSTIENAAEDIVKGSSNVDTSGHAYYKKKYEKQITNCTVTGDDGKDKVISKKEYEQARKTYNKFSNIFLSSYTKIATTLILGLLMVDLQITYILAFLGKEQIAESLSSSIATSVIAGLATYMARAFFDSHFEAKDDLAREMFIHQITGGDVYTPASTTDTNNNEEPVQVDNGTSSDAVSTTAVDTTPVATTEDEAHEL